MELPGEVVRALMDAGRSALSFNAPMGIDRAQGLADRLAEERPRTIVDLGCGLGEFARMLARRLPDATVVGVDTDAESIERARATTFAVGLSDRVRFEDSDASNWPGPVDAAVCIGASHAFGGPTAMLERLADVVPVGLAVIGDGVWNSEPSPWCVDTFGDLPDGPEALASDAVRAGWVVVESDRSTTREWDDFERGWIGGVRAVGTDDAELFASQREAEYERYRGVLGFGWLVVCHPRSLETTVGQRVR